MPKLRKTLFPLALVATFTMPPLLRAAELTFNIDRTQSHLTFSLETLAGTTVSSAQTPGSDTTSLSGTLSVDVTASTIQFLTTNNTQLAMQAVPQAPLPGGAPGTAPAQYGLNISIPSVGGGVTAARGWVADATSVSIPLSAGAFDATQLSLNFPDGVTPYNLVLSGNPVVGSISNPGLPVFNSLGGGTVSLVGDTYTLSVPILASGTVGVGGVTLLNVFAGQVVATATVPEPSSVALATIGALTLAAVARRQRA